jgi:hypothetical protein
VLVPRMATQCRAQRTQGVRINGSKGFQGTLTLPGSLHAARPLFGSICAPEAEYEQHPYGYPILWSRRTSISPVDVPHGSFRETVAKDVGRLVPDSNGSPPSFLLLPRPIQMHPPRPIRCLPSRRPTTRATARRSSRPPVPIRYTSWATTSPRHTTTFIHANRPPQYQCTRRPRFH